MDGIHHTHRVVLHILCAVDAPFLFPHFSISIRFSERIAAAASNMRELMNKIAILYSYNAITCFHIVLSIQLLTVWVCAAAENRRTKQKMLNKSLKSGAVGSFTISISSSYSNAERFFFVRFFLLDLKSAILGHQSAIIRVQYSRGEDMISEFIISANVLESPLKESSRLMFQIS